MGYHRYSPPWFKMYCFTQPAAVFTPANYAGSYADIGSFSSGPQLLQSHSTRQLRHLVRCYALVVEEEVEELVRALQGRLKRWGRELLCQAP